MPQIPQLIGKEFAKGDILYNGHSDFHNFEISQKNNLRLLHTDNQTIQSALDLNNPEQMPLPYMNVMMAGLLFQPPPKSCLLLGSGGGDLIRYLHYYLPAAHITGVDHDARMIEIAYEYFRCPKSDEIDIHAKDAETFIKTQQSGATDLILVDLYGRKLPPFLNDSGFYAECRRTLSENGILSLNLLTNNAEEFKSILWKIRQCFNQQTLCLTAPVYNNIIILAFKKRQGHTEKASLDSKATSLSSQYGIDFSELVENIFATNPLVDGELCF